MPKPYTPNDAWSRKAAKEGFRARSVYKLMELDERFHLLKPGQTVLDLAAAPGSWLQYASKRIGPKGLAIGFDLKPIAPIADNVRTFEQDITQPEKIDSLLEAEHLPAIGLVLSDIAPSTSGIRDVDQWRSIELNQAVLAIAERWLTSGGFCVLKVFRGADFDGFLREVKAQWKDVRIATPRASRDRSKEVYLVMKKL
ncbi:MAG: RlmE family RNA methyltransferase [Candidatus Peribacteraceae bacterium]|nr:RlmE family RNA methyltransferase [Candidatus Peribacteraceae bacterium]MDD5739376.1 RlmE family RNA methyltransferase [Candidatus Peribacteraceae bacterium]